jgi:RecA-family ATPase
MNEQIEKTKQIDELERLLLGALIFKPNLIEICNISDRDFLNQKGKKVFSEIATIWEESRPAEIDPQFLYGRLSGDGNDGIGAYIGSCENGGIKLDPENFKSRLTLLRQKRLELAMLNAEKEGDYNRLISLTDEYRKLHESKEVPLISGSQIQALEVHVSWVLDRFIPEKAITVLYAPGGTGKTTLALQISNAIAEGQQDLFGLKTTQKTCIYLDFENPLPVLADRVRQLQVNNVLFWHLSAEPHPPLLDSDNFSLLFSLPPESVLIFDSLRSAFGGDENSSQDVSIVFSRLKQLREDGYTIILLHHTPKANDKTYKGSTAISDLADHTLCLSRVNDEGQEIETSELLPETRYFFSTGLKSRYERYGVFLFFDGKQFTLAPDPNEEALREIHAYLLSEGPKSLKELKEWIKENLEVSKKSQKITSLLKKGENRFWNVTWENRKKPKIYAAINLGTAREQQEKIQ